MDQSKKTMRHFYCRDVLWETFEQMANDFDCSIDYLVNESMRYYARSKNYGGGDAKPPTPGAGRDARMTAPSMPSQGRTQPVTSQPAVTGAPRRPPGATPGYPGSSQASVPVSTTASPSTAARNAGSANNAANLPASAAPAAAAGPTLFLLYNGQRYTVAKDQFIIGRGSKSSDLAIKDGNISRKHAAVIRRNGTFYIKDLGSTNGIDYKGMRIDNKRIDEGDTFHLCDYELRFTYRGD